MNVSIVTLVWNNWHVAKNGLLSMRRLLDREDVCELLVLDNGSTDETRAAVRCVQDWPKTRLIRSDENLGCGGGRQVLFSSAQGDRILSLDSDAIVVDASIIDILETAAQSHSACIVGDYGGNIKPRWRFGFQKQPFNGNRVAGYVDVLDGYCHYINRSLVDYSVRFDAQWHRNGPEDADFCLESTLASGRPCYMMPVPILHTWTQSVPGNRYDHWTALAAKWNPIFPGPQSSRRRFNPTAKIPQYPREMSPEQASRILGAHVRHVLEIGANDGSDTIRLLKAFPCATIHCFEPDPRAIARWKRNVCDARAVLYELAISDMAGDVPFYQSGGQRNDGHFAGYGDWDKSGSLLPVDRHREWCPWMTFDSTVTVHSTTLDAWAKSSLPETARIGFAWIDAQGYEDRILRSGQSVMARTQMVFAECHTLPHYKGQATLEQLSDALPHMRLTGAYACDNYLWINRSNVLR